MGAQYTVGKRQGRRNQNRPPRYGASADRPSSPRQPTRAEEDTAAVREAMRRTNFVLMAADAGLVAVEEEDRKELLVGVGAVASIRELARVFSRLDLALMLDWSEKRMQKALLNSVGASWADGLIPRIDNGDRLLTATSLSQLMREIAENGSDLPAAPPLPTATVVHYLLSINTEHHRIPGYSSTGVVTEDDYDKMARELSGLDTEDNIAMLRNNMQGEIAHTLAEVTLSPLVLRAETEDTWFKPWPEKVTDPGLGSTPAECFESVHGLALVEVLKLGAIVDDLAREGVVEFDRTTLLGHGASEAAVEVCFAEMSRPLGQYRRALRGDRRRGPVHQQRYTMARFPFLRIDADTLILLRYQWGIDRFYGNLLYWSTFSGLPGFALPTPEPRSLAEAFSDGMNHIFERTVGDILDALVSRSATARRLLTEQELQTAWTVSSGVTASACDWVIDAGKACLVIDATNHALNARVSEGLATPEDYAEDVTRTFASDDGKFGQLVRTMRNLRDRGAADFDLHPASVFVPIVALPHGGLPNFDSTDLDFQIRSQPFFAEFNGRILAPIAVTITELQILEGMAGRFGFPDPIRTFVQWRYACTRTPWPIRLRDYLDLTLANPNRPLAKRLLDSSDALLRRID